MSRLVYFSPAPSAVIAMSANRAKPASKIGATRFIVAGPVGICCQIFEPLLQQRLNFFFEDRFVVVAYKPAHDAALSINYKGSGNGIDSTVGLDDFLVSDHNRVVYTQSFYELLHDVGTLFVQRDADDRQTLVTVLLLQLDKVRDLYATRNAPRRPEIHNQNVAAEIGKLYRLTVQISEFPVGRWCSRWRSFLRERRCRFQTDEPNGNETRKAGGTHGANAISFHHDNIKDALRRLLFPLQCCSPNSSRLAKIFTSVSLTACRRRASAPLAMFMTEQAE